MLKYIQKRMNWVIGTLLFLIVLVLLAMFINQYMVLGETIEAERATYVSEIKNQLVKNIKAEKEQQIALVNIYGQVLTDLKPQHFEEINNLLSTKQNETAGDEILLMDTQGKVYTLQGKEKKLSEQGLAYALAVAKQEVFGYSQVNQREEYWIYGLPIETIVVDRIEVCAVINARSVKNFGERMSTSILDNDAFSYIMSKSGNILVFPAVENNMGYNLFYTLEEYGVDKSSIAEIKSDFADGTDGKKLLRYDGNKWLLDYSGDMFDDWVVVVMMPMTITGADTYKILNETLASILTLFGGIVVWVMYIIRRFYLRERRREQAIAQEKAELVIAQGIAASKNEFLAKMSHDIRTPLNAIIGLIHLTSKLVTDRPKAAHNLNQAARSAEYLLSILNAILDMSKIESGKMEVRDEPFDLHKVVDSLRAMNLVQADAKQIVLEINIQGEVAESYLGDKAKISQILMNLLSNAVKFTNPGGHILLSVTAKTESEGMDQITFLVKDDGAGMSQEYLARIFEPFEQEADTQVMNYHGSGLGLAIVKNLVDLMNGTIEVESKKGVGSCFTVVLHLARTGKPDETDASEITLDLQGKKVLLAEDNDINAMIAKELLEAYTGVNVYAVENGQRAVEEFTQSKEGEYYAILMDIRMPVMNGLEATQKIRSLPHPQAQTIPIIAMSANAFDEDIQKALDCGMNEYLSKPIDVQKVLGALQNILGER